MHLLLGGDPGMVQNWAYTFMAHSKLDRVLHQIKGLKCVILSQNAAESKNLYSDTCHLVTCSKSSHAATVSFWVAHGAAKNLVVTQMRPFASLRVTFGTILVLKAKNGMLRSAQHDKHFEGRKSVNLFPPENEPFRDLKPKWRLYDRFSSHIEMLLYLSNTTMDIIKLAWLFSPSNAQPCSPKVKSPRKGCPPSAL
jgi:hypothetical protein